MSSTMFGGYNTAVDWSGDPYQTSDSPGLAATSPRAAGQVITDGGAVGSTAAGATGTGGNPVQGMIIALVIIVVMMVVIHRIGGREENNFHNIKASVWNAFVIGVMAAAIIPLLKVGSQSLAQTNLPGTKALATYLTGA